MSIYEILYTYAKLGDKFYSTIHGDVELAEFLSESQSIKFIARNNNGVQTYAFYTLHGRLSENFSGECALFPSKDQRDWDKWVKEKEAELRSQYKIGDRILIKDIKTGDTKTEVNDLLLITSIDGDEASGVLLRTGQVFPAFHIDDANPPTKLDRYDPKLLKPFDKVLAREPGCKWHIAHFEEYRPNACYPVHLPYVTENGYEWSCCIPYNMETEHLIGKTGEEPEFYR